MLRLPERLKTWLTETLVLFFVGWALLRPWLQVSLLSGQSGWAMGLTALLSAALSGIGLLRGRAHKLAVLGALLLGIAAALLSPLPQALSALVSALVAVQPLTPIVLLYADALLPAFALVTLLYARLLTRGEPGFSVPLLLSTVLMMWFSGARSSVVDFMPTVVAVALLFGYANHPDDAPDLPNGSRGRRTLLWTLPVAAVILLFSSLLTPPYRSTNPQLEEKADQLRQTIEDYFFFTESRESFSIAAAGYQPMGDEGLGGKPQISNALALEVDTDRRVYLRGTIMDFYSGRQWFDTVSKERYAYSSLRWQSLRDELLDVDLPAPGERLDGHRVGVQVLQALPSTLFVPQRLRELSMGEGMVPYLNRSSELFITRNLKEGDAYSFSYEPYVAGEKATDALARQLSTLAPADRDAIYHQMPQHLQPDGLVATLTAQIIGREQDPYTKAMLIRDYLRANYRYTLEVATPPTDMDFVAHFLFDTKEGYCTYFASAMTVMARMAGIPSRYVEGFVAVPNENGGPAVLTGQNAHAWTEVYISGLGWVTIDATASTGSLPPPPEQDPPPGGQEPEPTPQPSPEPTPSPAPGDSEPSPEPSPEPQPSEQPTQEPIPQEQSPDTQPPEEPPERPRGPWLWILLALLLLVFLIWRLRESDPHRRAKAGSARDQVLTYWNAMALARAIGGQPMEPQETLREYALRLAPQDRGLSSLAESVSALVYGRHLAAPDRVTAARLYYQAAWQQLSLPRRLRFAARNLLTDLAQLPGKAWAYLKPWARGMLGHQ